MIQMLSELYGYYTDYPEAMSRIQELRNTGEYLRNRQYVIIFRNDGSVFHGEIQGDSATESLGGLLNGKEDKHALVQMTS